MLLSIGISLKFLLLFFFIIFILFFASCFSVIERCVVLTHIETRAKQSSVKESWNLKVQIFLNLNKLINAGRLFYHVCWPRVLTSYLKPTMLMKVFIFFLAMSLFFFGLLTNNMIKQMKFTRPDFLYQLHIYPVCLLCSL